MDDIHRELGRIMWNECGMSRDAAGLEKAIERIPELREEFWENAAVVGSGDTINQVLERAGRGFRPASQSERAYMVRLQGFSVLFRAQSAMAREELPAIELLEGALLLLVGIALLLPGFITDAVGFLLLVPGVRAAVLRCAPVPAAPAEPARVPPKAPRRGALVLGGPDDASVVRQLEAAAKDAPPAKPKLLPWEPQSLPVAAEPARKPEPKQDTAPPAPKPEPKPVEPIPPPAPTPSEEKPERIRIM